MIIAGNGMLNVGLLIMILMLLIRGDVILNEMKNDRPTGMDGLVMNTRKKNISKSSRKKSSWLCL